MARKKNAVEIKEPDEYRGLVRLAMLDFRGRHQRKPHDFEEFWEWCHRYGSDELFREVNSQVSHLDIYSWPSRPVVRGDQPIGPNPPRPRASLRQARHPIKLQKRSSDRRAQVAKAA